MDPAEFVDYTKAENNINTLTADSLKFRLSALTCPSEVDFDRLEEFSWKEFRWKEFRWKE